MPAMRLPARLVLSRRPRSRIEMGLEWYELPMAMEPLRRLSGLNSLPRRSMFAANGGAWWSPCWGRALFAACSWLVRLDVWLGGDARGVAMSMGDAEEAMPPGNFEVVEGGNVSSSESGRKIRSSRSNSKCFCGWLSWCCHWGAHESDDDDGREEGVCARGLLLSEVVEGDDASEGVGGVDGITSRDSADESRMAVSGENELGQSVYLRKLPGDHLKSVFPRLDREKSLRDRFSRAATNE